MNTLSHQRLYTINMYTACIVSIVDDHCNVAYYHSKHIDSKYKSYHYRHTNIMYQYIISTLQHCSENNESQKIHHNFLELQLHYYFINLPDYRTLLYPTSIVKSLLIMRAYHNKR